MHLHVRNLRSRSVQKTSRLEFLRLHLCPPSPRWRWNMEILVITRIIGARHIVSMVSMRWIGRVRTERVLIGKVNLSQEATELFGLERHLGHQHRLRTLYNNVSHFQTWFVTLAQSRCIIVCTDVHTVHGMVSTTVLAVMGKSWECNYEATFSASVLTCRNSSSISWSVQASSEAPGA